VRRIAPFVVIVAASPPALVAFSCGGQVSPSTPDDTQEAASSSGGSSGTSGNSSGTTGSSSGGGSSSSSSSSGASSGSGSSSSSSGGPDAGADAPCIQNGWDAAIADGSVEDAVIDAAPPPAGLAGFAFVINGVAQTPMNCPAANWEFPWPQGEGAPGCMYPPIPGINSVVIVNTGTQPLPYIAQNVWNGNGHYRPGVLTGDPYQLAGVLQPGTQVDITSVYVGGFVALVGSADPFSEADGHYAGDEGTVPWPKGVDGSGGATTMNVALIEVPIFPMSMCTNPSQLW
jgi:hypothetical protein